MLSHAYVQVVAILKIQDGCHDAILYSDNVLNAIIEFFVLRNIYLDTKIMTLSGLEAEIYSVMCSNIAVVMTI